MRVDYSNPPDIMRFRSLVEKYVEQIEESENIKTVFETWQNGIIYTYVDGFSFLFRTEESLDKFLLDVSRRTYLALCIAWALGREFAEVYPEDGYILLGIDDCRSEIIPENSRNEITDITKFASYLLENMIKSGYNAGKISKPTYVQTTEITGKIFREGLFLIFQEGIASFYKKAT